MMSARISGDADHGAALRHRSREFVPRVREVLRRPLQRRQRLLVEALHRRRERIEQHALRAGNVAEAHRLLHLQFLLDRQRAEHLLQFLHPTHGIFERRGEQLRRLGRFGAGGRGEVAHQPDQVLHHRRSDVVRAGEGADDLLPRRLVDAREFADLSHQQGHRIARAERRAAGGIKPRRQRIHRALGLFRPRDDSNQRRRRNADADQPENDRPHRSAESTHALGEHHERAGNAREVAGERLVPEHDQLAPGSRGSECRLVRAFGQCFESRLGCTRSTGKRLLRLRDLRVDADQRLLEIGSSHSDRTRCQADP
jgi:hypothetical protein